jgi:hypothetical protein
MLPFMKRRKNMAAMAWLDISVIQCPSCRRYYADASWYVVEIGADIECGTCHTTFNTNKNKTDRIMLRLVLSDEGEVHEAEVGEALGKKQKGLSYQQSNIYLL